VQDTTSWITSYYRGQNVWVSHCVYFKDIYYVTNGNVCVFKNYETEIQESDPNDNPAGMNSSGKAHLEMCFEI